MKRIVTLVFVVLLMILAAGAGCTKDQIHVAAFESMRHMSNRENAQNPNYDPDKVGEYGVYGAQREEYLQEWRNSGE